MAKALMAMALAALVAAPAMSQDRGGKKPPDMTGPCDTKQTEKVKWCPKCDKVLEKADIEKDKHKGDCGEAAKEIELCCKKLYACGCGGSCCQVEQATPGKCSCNKPLKAKDDKCKVMHECETCGAKGPVAADVQHDEEKHKDKKEKKLKRTCEKSGAAPHSTQAK
jgi:hypothetical protein